ncbi:MAG: hypothetical protein ACRDD8_13185 [Bacteroidales bacterium]
MIKRIKNLLCRKKHQKLDDGDILISHLMHNIKAYGFHYLDFIYTAVEYKPDRILKGIIYISDKLEEKTLRLDVTFDFILGQKIILAEGKNHYFSINNNSNSFYVSLFDIVYRKFK